MMLLGVALVCSLGLLAGASVLVVKCVRAAGARPLAPSMRLVLGGLAAIYLVSEELYGSPGAVFATAIGGVTMPFVFYAKLSNVDTPYLFWFAWSMVFYARFVKNGRRADALGFALTAATAVETKDQAYGFYL